MTSRRIDHSARDLPVSPDGGVDSTAGIHPKTWAALQAVSVQRCVNEKGHKKTFDEDVDNRGCWV